MEVAIKKVKLTSTLFNQIQFLDKEDILSEEFEPIGWCIIKSPTKLYLKYYVLNDIKNGELRKMLAFGYIDDSAENYLELINPYLQISNQKIEVANQSSEWYDLKGLLHKIKRIAEGKGQFYL